MTCPNCQNNWDLRSGEGCPACGSSTRRRAAGVLKTSTILISSGNRRGEVYRSFTDVPEPLRGKLIRTTNGANSGTIVIADRRGKERIPRALLDQQHASQWRHKPFFSKKIPHIPLVGWISLLCVPLVAAGAWLLLSRSSW